MNDAIDFTGELTGTLTRYIVNDKDYPHSIFDPDVRPYSKVQCLRIGGHDFPLPSKGSDEAAGFDLQSTETFDLYPEQQKLIPIGWAFAIPVGHVGIIKDRSGMAYKRIITHAGVVDSDYRGEVKVLLENAGDRLTHIIAGDRIAQMLILPCPYVCIEETSELDETSRGSGGFGSTGI